EVCQLHGLENVVRTLAEAKLLGARAPRRGEHADERLADLIVSVDEQVFEHRHSPERAGDLKGAPDTAPGDCVRRQAVETIGAQTDLAMVGGREATDHVEERRLARAVWSNEARDRSLGDRQRAAGERFDAAEAFGDAADRQEWRCRHRACAIAAYHTSSPRAAGAPRAGPPPRGARPPPSPRRRYRNDPQRAHP